MTLYLFRQVGTMKQAWGAVSSKFSLFLRVVVRRWVCKEVEEQIRLLEMCRDFHRLRWCTRQQPPASLTRSRLYAVRSMSEVINSGDTS